MINKQTGEARLITGGSQPLSDGKTLTKAMQAEVAKLREVVQELNKAARIAQGEEKAGGGFFGVGGKTPSKTELAAEVKDLYMKGGNAFNQYVYAANDGLPVQLNKLPFL